MCHQIDQLKEEIKEKDVRMIEDEGCFFGGQKSREVILFCVKVEIFSLLPTG